MSSASGFLKFIIMTTALLLLGGCDDDDGDKKTKYEVEIYVSDDIKWEVTEMKPQGRFKKPLIEVHRPEGVDAKGVEKKPKKTIVYEFSRPDLAFASWALALLVGLWMTQRHLPYGRLFPPSSLSTYQRG